MTPSPQPLLVIRPRGPYWRNVPREIVAARFMFWNMVRSAALAPYANVVLGPLWTMLRPLIFLAVIVLVRRFSGASMGEPIHYSLYLYSGLVLWWYLVDASRQSSRSMFSYRGIVTKIYFPRIVAPAVPVVARLVDLAVQLAPLALFMGYHGQWPGVRLLLLPVVLLHAMLLCLGLGYLFGAMAALSRDADRVLDYILYVGLFLSPVIYSTQIVPAEYRLLYAVLNPAVGPLLAWRATLFDAVGLDTTLWLLSLLSTLVLLVAGAIAFARIERRLGESVL